jgi:hypothetical protein
MTMTTHAADVDIVAVIEPRLRSSHIWPRSTADWYVEPEWCSARPFDVETFVGSIHDPAAGMGRIVDAARAHGHHATAADLIDRGFCFAIADFALVTTPVDNIVVNPPFGRGLQAARQTFAGSSSSRALWVSKRSAGCIAMEPCHDARRHQARRRCRRGDLQSAVV